MVDRAVIVGARRAAEPTPFDVTNIFTAWRARPVWWCRGESGHAIGRWACDVGQRGPRQTPGSPLGPYGINVTNKVGW